MAGLTIATYNIHSCIGRDGRYDPSRVARVIRETGADIVALQEVDNGYRIKAAWEMISILENETGMKAVVGPTLYSTGGFFGNVILTGYPVMDAGRYSMGVRPYEPRGLIVFRPGGDAEGITILATHLGLRIRERKNQVARLREILADNSERPVVLAGDFNDWIPFSPTVRSILGHGGKGTCLRTWPSAFPLFPLDRLLSDPPALLSRLRVHRTETSRLASDHLPLLGDIEIP